LGYQLSQDDAAEERRGALAGLSPQCRDLQDAGSGPAAMVLAHPVKYGADGKIKLAENLAADVTVNTDFAQTEVDQAVVNLTRFPVFFPE
jgi:hypothetical protein